MPRGRSENLLKSSDLTSAQLRERASKGGRASAKKRQELKTLKEYIEIALALPDPEGLAIDGKTINNAMGIMLSMVAKAKAGSTEAATFIRDTIGQKPATKTELTGANAGPVMVLGSSVDASVLVKARQIAEELSANDGNTP